MKFKFRKILCAVDFSDTSDYALQYAASLADALGAHLEVLHVMDMPYVPSSSVAVTEDIGKLAEHIKRECEERLKALVEKYCEKRALVRCRVVTGTAFLEIIRAAKDGKADLVVVGTRGRSGLKYIFLGSVAEKVVRKAPCPVLAVKNPHQRDESE